MKAVVLQTEALSLPHIFATKQSSKKIEIVERDNSIVIKPVEYSAKSMRGMFKSNGHAVDRFMAQKKLEKELHERG